MNLLDFLSELHKLEPLTQIFLVTFSILYGIMLNSCLGLELFPFGRFGTHCKKIGRRILKSFVILNLLPVLPFSIVLYLLQTTKPGLTVITSIGIFILSITVFGCYRVMLLCIVYRKGQWFYDDTLNCVFQPPNRRLKYLLGKGVEKPSVKGQTIGVLFYIMLFAIGAALTFWQNVVTCPPLLIFLISLFAVLSIVILHLSNGKNK